LIKFQVFALWSIFQAHFTLELYMLYLTYFVWGDFNYMCYPWIWN